MSREIVFVDFSTKVFYPVPWEKIVIPCSIVEITDIYTAPNVDGAIWHYRYPDGESRVMVPTEEKDENGWPKSKEVDVSALQTMQRVNQLLYLDEPVGHDVQINNDAFLTLAEALAYVKPSRKKSLQARLRRFRGSSMRFIAMTWDRWGEGEVATFEPYPPKRVYVHKPHRRFSKSDGKR